MSVQLLQGDCLELMKEIPDGSVDMVLAEKQYKPYPVLGGLGERRKEYIPLDVLAPFEDRAIRNHGQTLEQLAARGGLGWVEIVWILLDKRWGGPPNPPDDVARSAVLKYVAAWKEEQEAVKCSNNS